MVASDNIDREHVASVTDYDAEPVKYCAKCYSLKIVYEDTVDSDCCYECGSSDVLEAPIDVWEKKYERRYGHKFVTRSSDPNTLMVSRMGIKELQNFVCDSPEWKRIVFTMYPSFPRGFGKTDSVILLFNKILKDGRLNDLREIIVKLLNKRY
jgi:hypothetical protein